MKRTDSISRRGFLAGGAAACGAAGLALAGCSSTESSSSSDSSNSSGSSTSSGALPCGNVETEEGYYLIEEGKLTIGSDLDYPPMEQLEDDGKPSGYDVAMMQEICDRIGLEMNYLSPQDFDTLITQVNAGATLDVAVSSITITDEREELVAFSEPYYDSNQAVVIMKGAYTDRSELNDASVKVTAQSGTTGEEWIAENLPNATYVSYKTTSDCVAAIVAGEVQAAIYDQPVAESHVANQFTDCEILEVIATGEQYGIAINQENTTLLSAINTALSEMKKDGVFEEIAAEYF